MEDISKKPNNFLDIGGNVELPAGMDHDGFLDILMDWTNEHDIKMFIHTKPTIDPKHPMEIVDNETHCKELWKTVFDVNTDPEKPYLKMYRFGTHSNIRHYMSSINIHQNGFISADRHGEPQHIDMFKVVNKLVYLGYDMPIPDFDLDNTTDEQ